MTTHPNPEVKRQSEYLERLPENYQFPLFNTMQALQSQRQNGYRNTAAAAREIVDNAIEAGADNIDVLLCRPDQRNLAKNARKNAVSAIAFVDDGPGMLPRMARYALSWGGGTHFDDHEFIGKFGFGLPNASINQTTHVAVYTRTDADEPITVVRLNLDDYKEYGLQEVPEPEEGDLPEFVEQFLQKEKRKFETGTVVVWDRPDRLTYRMASELKPLLIDDFGSTYRNHLGKFTLTVDGTAVEPVDPLFTSSSMKYFLPENKGGAITTYEDTLPVRYYEELDTGGRHLMRLEDEGDLEREGEKTLSTGNISVRIVRLPVGFATYKKRGKADTDAKRRFEIRKSRRGMSFVRAGREIETVDAFPRSAKDVAAGLGNWPLLQGYAYHWGIEVKFDPKLDAAFGITNDKQTVRPLEDFWKILAKEEIDKHLHQENRWQTKARKRQETEEAQKEDAKRDTQPTKAELAAAKADTASSRRPTVPKSRAKDVEAVTELEAARRAKETKKDHAEVLETMREERQRRPYRIAFAEDPNGPFFIPSFGPNAQIVATINTTHPFYTMAYSRLTLGGGDGRARDTIDLLIIMLAKSELETEDDDMLLFYEAQREQQWSPFLKYALQTLENDIDKDAPENEKHEDEDAA